MAALTITIRIILTVVLLCGVYCETGVFTAAAMALVFVAVELQNISIKQIKSIFSGL